jgi:hypothetical protein
MDETCGRVFGAAAGLLVSGEARGGRLEVGTSLSSMPART